tara:strand:- start:806 stop:1078 length:273 start_codon:yes stop_codon:yes gene_type:complete
VKLTDQHTTEEYKAEITRLRERDIKQRSTIRSLTTSRDSLKEKHENKLRTVLKLKIDGYLELTHNDIAKRYFASYSHIKNLSALIRREIK